MSRVTIAELRSLREVNRHNLCLNKELEAAQATIARQSKIIDEVYRVLHEESFSEMYAGKRVVYTDDIHAVLDVDEPEDVG